MDPALLNYLQSQQQSEQMGDMGQMPQEQMLQEQMPPIPQEQMQPIQQPQEPQMLPMPQNPMQPQKEAYNPFDAGIRKAISSARESLGMTDQQGDRALRRSMLTLADNISMQPKQKGFLNNLGLAGRALSPAITAYDESEEAALSQNQALANQMLAYQAAEQQRQAKEEEQAWKRQQFENQFGEQQTMNKAKLDILGMQRNKLEQDERRREQEELRLGEQGMEAIPQYDKDTLKLIVKDNIDNQKEIYKSNKASKVTIDALTDMKDILEKEQNSGSWQQGSSTSAQIARFLAKTAGQNTAQKALELKRMPLFDSLKKKFGARITNLDLELFIAGLPGLDQPAEVAIPELAQRIQAEENIMLERNIRADVVENEFNNKVPIYSTMVNKRVDEELSLLSEQDTAIQGGVDADQGGPVDIQDGKVTIRAPDGSVARVSPEFASILVQKGGEILDE